MSPAWTFILVTSLLMVTPSAGASEPQGDAEPAAKQATEVERPGPWIFFREQVAVAGWPSGLITDTRVQLRGALHRDNSIVFQDTYAGVGARLAVTPAFVEVGPRLSFAPIDIFDVDVQASFIGYWPSSSGLLPYENIEESTRDLDRKARYQDPDTTAEPGYAFRVEAAPTLKLKIGPIIGLSSWSFAYYWFHQTDGNDSPLVYEPFNDRLMERHDMVITHQAALISEFLDGQNKPLLWVGATYIDRITLRSKDRSIRVGGLAVFQPSYKRGWPRFVVQVTPYVKDPDRVGGVPALALAIVWTRDMPLKQLAGM